jgi:hypothetical protein
MDEWVREDFMPQMGAGKDFKSAFVFGLQSGLLSKAEFDEILFKHLYSSL